MVCVGCGVWDVVWCVAWCGVCVVCVVCCWRGGERAVRCVWRVMALVMGLFVHSFNFIKHLFPLFAFDQVLLFRYFIVLE